MSDAEDTSLTAAVEVPAPQDLPAAAAKPQPLALSPEELRAALVKQIEFYFSDANIVTDKHLLGIIKKAPEGFGREQSHAIASRRWPCARGGRTVSSIPPCRTSTSPSQSLCLTVCPPYVLPHPSAVAIKAIASFKRVKALTKDLAVVQEALQTSEQLVVSADGTQVRRARLAYRQGLRRASAAESGDGRSRASGAGVPGLPAGAAARVWQRKAAWPCIRAGG
jgi:hypothetical protein